MRARGVKKNVLMSARYAIYIHVTIQGHDVYRMKMYFVLDLMVNILLIYLTHKKGKICVKLNVNSTEVQKAASSNRR